MLFCTQMIPHCDTVERYNTIWGDKVYWLKTLALMLKSHLEGWCHFEGIINSADIVFIDTIILIWKK